MIRPELQDDIRNASILFVICLLGFLMNVYSSITLLRHRSFRNPFGKLTVFHTSCNACVLLLLLCWCPTMTMLNSFVRLDSPLFWQVNYRVGQFCNFFQECSHHVCLVISFNRLLAIGKPMISRQIFNDRNTNYIVFVIVFLCFIFWLIYFLPGCNFYYNTPTDTWLFDDTYCGAILTAIDFYYNVGLFIVNCMIDIITLFLLRGANERIFKAATNKNRIDAHRRQKREILFFSQAFLNTIVYCFMLLSFHVLCTVFEDLFLVFLSTTVMWACAHSSGGLIVILFNRELRRSLTCWKRNRTKNVVAVFSTHRPLSMST